MKTKPRAAPHDTLDRLEWHSDRLLLDDLTFYLDLPEALYREPIPEEELRLVKKRELMDQFAQFFRERPDFRPQRILEIGLYGGGSVVLWNEILQPTRHQGVDRIKRWNSPVLDRWLEGHPEVELFWGVDASDRVQLRGVADADLDLVIDDGAHTYECLLPSFETLFPRLRPGGFYVIEDWAWAHSPEFAGAKRHAADPTRLVTQLVEAAGTDRDLIPEVHLTSGFTAVERGPRAIEDALSFRLEDHIFRRPPPTLKERSARIFRRGYRRRVYSTLNSFKRRAKP